MGGPEHLLDLPVVGASLIDVLDHQANGRARGDTFEDAGQDLHLVRLPSLGRVPGPAGGAAVQVRLQIGFSQCKARGTPVDDGSQRRPVAFAEGRDREELSKRVPSHQMPLLDSDGN